MGNSTRRIGRIPALLVLGITLSLGWGCAGHLGTMTVYSYFSQPEPDDAWSRKIRAWQQRERLASEADAVQIAGVADGPAEPAEPGAEPVGELRSKYDTFRAERKRSLARELAAWIQEQAPQHYVADGPVDHWATLQETFRSNGDDCDGLELLAYYFLRDLGFGEDEVFRAIVYRRTDGQHHMVTLWFEDPDDPWVIDPTGAMTLGMPRMSEVPDWVPLKVFSEDRDYTVRRERVASHP